MKRKFFTGLFTAVVTPFDKNYDVDYNAFEKVVQFQIDSGADGVVVNGSTGESQSVSEDEFIKLMEIALRLCKGKMKVIAGTSNPNTKESVKKSILAQSLGASGLLLVTPAYCRPSQEGLIAHFLEIAEAVQIPIMLYNNPARTCVDLLPNTTKELSSKNNIVGIKEASSDFSRLVELLSLNFKDDFAITTAIDYFAVPLISLGGDGVISVAGNVIPLQMKQIIELSLNNEFEKASTLASKVYPFIKSLTSLGINPIVLKAVMSDMGLIEDILRLPLLPLDSDAKTEAIKIYNEMQDKLKND